MTTVIQERIARLTDDELRSEYVSASRRRDRDVVDALIREAADRELDRRRILVRAILREMEGY